MASTACGVDAPIDGLVFDAGVHDAGAHDAAGPMPDAGLDGALDGALDGEIMDGTAEGGADDPLPLEGVPADDEPAGSGPHTAPGDGTRPDDVGAAAPDPQHKRTPLIGAIRFRRASAGDLTDHRFASTNGYHSGMALHDVDGDGDLDVFVGTADADGADPACLYRNASTPGAFDFRRVRQWCLGDLAATGAHFVPHDVPGEARAIVFGVDVFADVVFSHDGVDIVPFTPERIDPDVSCNASAGVLFDVELDGSMELVILCSAPGRSRGPVVAAADLVLDVTSRPPVVADVPPWPELEPGSMTLAAAIDDFDDDGLLDLISINDTYSSPRSAHTALEPGGTRRRCAPGEPCTWDPQHFATGLDAWGNHMGYARIEVDGRTMHYISDYGPNLLVDLQSGAERHDEARAFGAQLDPAEPPWTYSWAVVPADFDGDGRDDLFVTQGSLSPHSTWHYRRHYNAVLANVGDGRFVPLSTSVGFRPLAVRDNTRESHRGTWRTDLDGDGRLDFLVSMSQGTPVVYRVDTDDDPAWCTVEPRPRVVPTWGYGDHASRPDGTVERTRVQGQVRHVIGRSLVTRTRSGFVEFASGARARFACEPGEHVIVDEPDWLSIEPMDGHVQIEITGPVGFPGDAPLVVALRSEGETVVADAGTVRAPDLVPLGEATHVMLAVRGRWIGRWWDLGPAR